MSGKQARSGLNGRTERTDMELQGKRSTTQRTKRDAELAAAQRHGERNGARHMVEITEEIDDLLADIDALLEEQSVLVHFRQRGGE